jgi:plasmid maintenance system antidote protein VapI
MAIQDGTTTSSPENTQDESTTAPHLRPAELTADDIAREQNMDIEAMKEALKEYRSEAHPIIEDGKMLDELNGKDPIGASLIKVYRAAGMTDKEIWENLQDF